MRLEKVAVFQLVTVAYLAQCAFGCPPPGNYFPVSNEYNQTYEALEKRGYPMNKQLGGLWPNAKITYYFADATARQNLKKIIPKAFGKWLAAGLSPKFEMKEGKASDCTADKRSEYLLISYNSDKKLVTTLGYYFGTTPRGTGPTSTLDPTDDFASGDGTGNIAHELGHAWGLLHEHQRPSLWTKKYAGNAAENTFKFTCENLKDYTTFSSDSKNDMERLCHYSTAANRARDSNNRPFSAYDILPDSDGVDPTGEVDWKSIMLYGSTCGAKEVNGALAITLTKADGTTFPYNTYPSQKDVETLNGLYHVILGEKKMDEVAMLWNKKNPKHGLFFMRNKSSSCS